MSVNALTVDLEDWYQGAGIDISAWPRYEDRVERATLRVLDVLEAHGARATFFALGYVAEHHPELIRAIAARGHEIATHGYSHRLLYECTPAEVREDLRRSIGVLEDIGQTAVLGYRAPFFSITRDSWWVLDIIAELGLRYDSSIFPIHHWRCGVPGAPRFAYVIETPSGPLVEFPPTTGRVLGVNVPLAGGAYLRAWPYGVTRTGIRRLNSGGRPAVVYIHPWELDTERPRVRVRRSIAVAQRLNRASAEPRLTSLLREFEFRPMGELVGAAPPPAVRRQSTRFVRAPARQPH